MDTAVSDLFDRAERAGAALSICDSQDRIVRVNATQSKIYNFIDFSARPTFEEATWRCIEHRKMAGPLVYQDPHTWIQAAAHYRQSCDYSQFIARHTDGRVLMVFYERVRTSQPWWYQIRVDITHELKKRLCRDDELLGPVCWDGNFTPLTKKANVPITNVLEAMPCAAALIMNRGRLLG